MEIWLSNGTSDKLQIPVNPQSIGYTDSSNFEDIVLASGDEKTVVSGRNLKTLTLSSFFPSKRANYVVTKKLLAPMEYVKKIESWMNGKKILQLQATKTNINIKVTVRSFTWEEIGGAVGDVEYTLELKEYKPVFYTKVGTTNSTSTRAPSKTTPKTHTVKSGDSLWSISKKYYGTDAKINAIYEKNKSIIGPNKNVLKVGQRLVLP